MYAGLFAPDGTFGQRSGAVQGKDALAAVARRFQRGPQSTFHFLMDHVIEPSPEGAVGKEYLAQFVFGDNGQPSRIFGGGHYDDVYEKTAEGWRFKRRQFIPSQSGFETTTPTAADRADDEDCHGVRQELDLDGVGLRGNPAADFTLPVRSGYRGRFRQSVCQRLLSRRGLCGRSEPRRRPREAGGVCVRTPAGAGSVVYAKLQHQRGHQTLT